MKVIEPTQTKSKLLLTIALRLLIKRFSALCFLVLAYTPGHTQCLIPSANGDSSFPVTNRFNTFYSIYAHIAYRAGANVFNITSSNGKYYLLGDFANLAKNHGPALVVDTATNTVKTPQKWKINGTVLTAVPDGQGGFFIGGEFTKIGDSTRKYMAQIDANGRPTSWNPRANGIVRTMQRRNDTLYIGGEFSTFLSRPKSCFAMYSITGDSLLRSRLSGNSSITSMLLLKDTLIFAGDGIAPLRKYNIKDSLNIQWQLSYMEYGPTDHLQFNEDSTIVIYLSKYNGHTIRAFKRSTNALQYSLGISIYIPDGNGGAIFSMRSVGKKVYAVGYFETVVRSSAIFARKGFFSFDGTTGDVSPDDLHLDGYPTFLWTENARLFLSGNFNTVNAVNRLNFAVVDTGLNVGSLQLSPSDPLTSLSFNNGRAFVSGYFNGIYATRRNGYAAIDSATGDILPWSPSNIEFTEGKRMQIKGDTVFVLGITGRPSSCMVNDFNTAFRMYRLSDGQQLTVPGMGSKIYDFTIDGNYLYVSADGSLRRFSLPNFAYDASWGTILGAGHIPMYLLVSGNKVYSVGDNRFEQQCTTLPERKGWFYTYDKSTGLPLSYYSYKGNSSYYDQITFDHALLVNDKLYIQGYFYNLNGKSRRNFACIDINSGNLTGWETPFSQTGIDYSFQQTSDLKLHNGQIWFGSPKFIYTNGKRFPGFGAIDTSTGILLPRSFNLDFEGYSTYAKSGSIQDFLFTNENMIGVGGFDYIDSILSISIAKLPLVSGPAPSANSATIIGVDTIYSNGQLNRFYLTPANTDLYSYSWTFTGNNAVINGNGSDTIRLAANPNGTSGDLIVKAVTHCGSVLIAQKTVVVAAPPPQLPLPVVTGISDKCFADPNARAKLNNPPANVSISILRDGLPLGYNAPDSSFQYFASQQTTIGTHTITIRFKYTYATMDSVSKDFTFFVQSTIIPAINISGTTTVNAGQLTSLSLSATNEGTNPLYQWQDSTASHTWQNIAGASNPTINYAPATTGDRIRCILTSNMACASPVTVTSNPLSFTVNVVTAVDPAPAFSKTIRLYPNPASTSIIIDSLRLGDQWKSLEIIDMLGQKTLFTYSIQNKTRLVVTVEQLEPGTYLVLLRRKSGATALKALVKQ